MTQETIEQVVQVECAWLAINQGHGIDAEDGLHLGVAVEIVEQYFGALTALQLDNDAHAIFI